MSDIDKNENIEKYENEERQKLFNRKKYFIGGSALLVAIGTVCLATGCFHSPDMNTSKVSPTKPIDGNTTRPPKPIPPLPDTEKFVKSWNNNIVKLDIKQIKSSNYKIDFSKYKIKKDPKKALQSLLSVDGNRLKKIREQLVSHKDKMYFKPLIAWIDEKLALGAYSLSKSMDTGELRKYVASIVNPRKSYSAHTTYKLIELNNFCYFFDKHRKKFYSDGYDRNIKTCDQIQEILVEDGIDFQIK